jgi:hypothetical protein
MAKNRKNQAVAGWFGAVLKAGLIMLVIAGSALGYVWQKEEIDRLGKLKHQREIRLTQLTDSNHRLAEQITILHSPVMLDQRVRELNLGLGPLQPGQVVRLQERAGPAVETKTDARQVAERADEPMTP